MQEFFLLIMDSPFLRQFACRLAAIFGVRCCQPDADSAFINLESQAALLVIVGLLAQLREFGCVFKQPLL